MKNKSNMREAAPDGNDTEITKFSSIPITQVKVGDIINVNTGYRPLDDENCEVLKIKRSTGSFGDEQIEFLIKSYHGNHWYSNPIYGQYGDKPKFEYTLTKVCT